eukprot:14894178-Alexandrium_andersonii.AAC.1
MARLRRAASAMLPCCLLLLAALGAWRPLACLLDARGCSRESNNFDHEGSLVSEVPAPAPAP